MAALLKPKVLAVAAIGAGALIVSSHYMRGEAGSATGKLLLQLQF